MFRRWNAAWNTFQKTPDPDEREKILTQAKLDAGAISSKRDAVNQDYQIHMDSTLPQWDRWYGTLDMGMRRQSARDDLTLNGAAQLTERNFSGYDETIKSGLDVGLYSQIEHDYLKENAAINSTFLIARKEAYHNRS